MPIIVGNVGQNVYLLAFPLDVTLVVLLEAFLSMVTTLIVVLVRFDGRENQTQFLSNKKILNYSL
jgi:hypothetical protein